ncbi:MAG: pseudaminic acid biosynthesis-associated methylase [Candidatus Riflebacteria bacterium HGW-Riflebacteria-1]|jgi:spore coat polysaccharide biosynthesis protein SpsF|nr:MAG: pseudaminic acid biosynthesis-associated methylase [Candidatus Riflebacteria bacterium HGW-Riflebacteria-1]
MKKISDFKTPQEEFWAGSFGVDYINRNESPQLLSANLSFYAAALKMAGKISSCIEFGANIGMNLKALRLLYPDIELKGVEINQEAAARLADLIGPANTLQTSIFDFEIKEKADLALIKGVLIHLNPDMLHIAYEKLYEASSKYILIAEYYNPSPITIKYRGHENRLFKRDFAGEMLEKYPDLKLLDYGFLYRRDPVFPQDDITWFLLGKS